MPAIPFVDLPAQYAPIQEDIERDVLDILRGCFFVGGKYLERFEEALADFVGVKHCVGTSSGTSALSVALQALGVGSGDRVIVPVNSFIASAFAVNHTGARPAFVDVLPDTYLINPRKVELYLRQNRISAVMPVHLYGQMADMKALKRICQNSGAYLIEDAAQAIGATQGGEHVGVFGDAACTSFWPSKNLGTIGQGGAILTNNTELAAKARSIVNQGSVSKYDHKYLGGNYRLDTIAAAQLFHALKCLPFWDEARRAIAQRYDAAFGQECSPRIGEGNLHSYHLYEYRCRSPRDRDLLEKRLKAAGIAYGFHYPHLISESPVYGNSGGVFWPTAQVLTKRLISLPIFPTMSDEQVCEVIEAVLS